MNHAARNALALLVFSLAMWPAIGAARCIPFIPGQTESAGGNLLIVPEGSGPSLASVGATITVTVWRCPGEPFGAEGIPAQDVWLTGVADDVLGFCAGSGIADGATNADGVTTFTSALAGGGQSASGLQVVLAGTQLDAPLPIALVSPDIDGDLDVDLVDVGRFAIDYHQGYDPRSDFDFDGQINIADVAILAVHLGSRCP